MGFNGVSQAESPAPFTQVKEMVVEKNQKQATNKLFLKLRKETLIKSAANDESLYEEEPNDYFQDADILNPGEVIAGDFSSYDLDIYEVHVPSSGILIIGSAHEESAVMDLGFQLTDRAENLIDLYDYKLEGTTELKAYKVKPGTYYVTVLDLENYASGDVYLLSAEMLYDDKTPPAKPKVHPVDDNDKAVSGTAEPGSYVWIEIAGSFVNDGGTLVSKEGKYSVKINPQKAGTIVSVTTLDSAGNQSEFTDVTVVDKTPPATLTVDKLTSKSKSVSGKTEANAAVVVKSGKNQLGKATADKKGNFKVTIKAQKKGTKLTIIAIDKAKNQKTVIHKVN